MEEKKGFSVKKGSMLPNLAAALGGLMLILSFFILVPRGISEHVDSLNGFTVPVFRWLPDGFSSWWISWEMCLLDLLLLFTALTLLSARALTKKGPAFCALPCTFFMLFLLVWTVIIGRGAFKGWNIPFLLLSLTVCILFQLTARGVVKTKIPLVVESFAAALLTLVLLLFVRDPPYCTPFLHAYGIWGYFPDYLFLLRFCCLFLGTGVLALSLEVTAAPRNWAGTGASGASQTQQKSSQLTGLPPTLAERRSVAECILLVFLTFGFYLIYWKYTLCKKVRAWCGEPENCGGEAACLVLVPFYSLYWLYSRGVKIYEASFQHDILVPDHAVRYLLLDLLGLGLVAYGMLQHEFNQIADCGGGQEAPDASTLSVPDSPAAPVKEDPPEEKTVGERLAEQWALLDKGLITREELKDRCRDILGIR